MGRLQHADLTRAAAAGAVLECRHNGGRDVIDAAWIREHCLEPADRTDPRGIRIVGASVSGRLSLSAIAFAYPLVFEDCVFDEAPDLDGADLYSLSFVDSRLPGLLANGLRVRRDLDLSGSVITGAHRSAASTSQRSAVWLCEASIGGRLLCVDSPLLGDGERSVQADRLRVGGVVRLIHGFIARGEVRLLGAEIGGSIDLTAATLSNPGGFALELGDATIGGSIFITDDVDGNAPTIDGRIDLNSAHVKGQVVIRELTLHGPGRPLLGRGYSTLRAGSRYAISAPRFTVGAEVTVEGATTIHGGIDLSAADLGGLTIGGQCRLICPGETAVELTNARVNSSLHVGVGCDIQGRFGLTRATVHGKVEMVGVRLSMPEDDLLLEGYGATVEGALELMDLQAVGGRVVLNSANLGFIVMRGASLTNPQGQTLNLRRATVGGSLLLLDGFRSEGRLVIDEATIEGRFDCSGGQFLSAVSPENPNADAITATSATILGGVYLGWKSCGPSIDLTGVRTTAFVDNPAAWPERTVITGFSYDRFDSSPDTVENAWGNRDRRLWLDRAVFDAGAYEQAARVFRQHGYTSEAESLLIGGRNAARRTARRYDSATRARGLGRHLRYLADWAYGFTVGYGYRPRRVVLGLVALFALVVAALMLPTVSATMRGVGAHGDVYGVDGALATTGTARPATDPAPTDPCGKGQIRCFNPLFYSIDTVVPLLDLGQRATWYPDPHAAWGAPTQYLLTLATLLGWLLSTVAVLSFARLARSA